MPRYAAAQAIAKVADRFPDLPPTRLDTSSLERRDAALAVAIHRTVLQRWITLSHLLDMCLRQPLEQLEPRMQAVLLTGAAQLIFINAPAHAAVDESVKLARKMVRPGAAGMANAVLRRVAGFIAHREPETPWTPGVNRLPGETGTIVLSQPLLPEPEEFAAHVAVATSHPKPVVERWLARMGEADTLRLCLHGTRVPPTIVAVEPTFEAVRNDDRYEPHEQAGFVVWRGSREQLVAFLGEGAARRVQDPAAARPALATRDLQPQRIIDFCAGRGTKSKQLLSLHPEAKLIAADPDEPRRRDLEQAFAGVQNVAVMDSGQVPLAVGEKLADLVVLDVPCSNSAVLARRPEARYRLSQRSLEDVTKLQRQIAQQGGRLTRSGGHILYATCSIEPEENQQQVAWMQKALGCHLVNEAMTLPGGEGTSYHDGSYHALLKKD